VANQHGLKLHHLEYTVHIELFLHAVYSFTGAVEKLIMLQYTLFCLLATLVTVWQCVSWFVLARSSSAFCMQIQDDTTYLNSKLKEKTLLYTSLNIVLYSECCG